MDEYLEDYIGKDPDDIDIDENVNDIIMLKRNMLREAHKTTFEARRVFLQWGKVLDEDGNKLNNKVMVPICDLSTKYLKNILKWSGYDFETNYDIILHTINEEYIYRLKHG